MTKRFGYIQKLTLFLSAFPVSLFAGECPTPPTSVYPSVTSKVDFDKKKKLYVYTYTLFNGAKSKLPIGSLKLGISERPFAFSNPSPKWVSTYDEGGDGLPKALSWLTGVEEVKPGRQIEGFVLKSYLPPGPIRFYIIGATEDRVGTPNSEDDEPTPDCPGFYDSAPGFEDRISGIVDGPAPENQIAVNLKLMDEKGEHDCGPISPYEENGLMNVLLKANKGLKISDINLNSLRFGVGQAPLASSKRLGRSEESILLQFETPKLAIECERDRVLFLSGKTNDGKDLFGGAPVKTKNCDKRPQRKKPDHRSNPWKSSSSNSH